MERGQPPTKQGALQTARDAGQPQERPAQPRERPAEEQIGEEKRNDAPPVQSDAVRRAKEAAAAKFKAEREARIKAEEDAKLAAEAAAEEKSQKDEATAAAKLKIAQRFLTDNKNKELARKKAMEVISEFPNTRAAKEAKDFLDKL
jgi:hypothetical protein